MNATTAGANVPMRSWSSTRVNDSAPTAISRKLDSGNPIPWAIRQALLTLFVIALLHYAVQVVISTLMTFHVNAILLRYTELCVVCLLLASQVRAIHTILTVEFVVEDGCLDGVDLWLVERVRYGNHCIWLDKVRISTVPKPKVLVQSLSDLYEEMTGQELP